VHRLLQSLPELGGERRRDAALSYLARNAAAWPLRLREALAADLIRLIEEPQLAEVFGAGSRAEVPIVGRLTAPSGPILVSGQIDRLVVTDHAVLIVDYKTDHAPAPGPEGVPAGYIDQLSLYRAVLGRLYPERQVRAAILWTETPELVEIPAPALDAALASLIQRNERA